MLLPIIIIFSIIIIGLTLVCAALHRISKLEIRYPATFGEKKTDETIMACLEEML